MRLLCLALALAAAGAGKLATKKKKVEIDESKLPPLADVLTDLELDEFAGALLERGIEDTKTFLGWGRSDVSIHGTELGWDRDLQKLIVAKLDEVPPKSGTKARFG